MTKEASDTTQNVAAYISSYLELVENVPNEIIRHVSHLHEKHNYYLQCLRKLESAIRLTTNGENSEAKIRKTLVLIQKCLVEIQSLSDEKLTIVQTIYDSLDSKARQLDHDYRNITSSGNANNVITPVKVMKENSRSHVPKQGLVSNYNHTMNGHDENIDEPERSSIRSTRDVESKSKLPKSNSSNSLDSIDRDDEDYPDHYNGRSSSPTLSSKRVSRRAVSKPKESVHEKKREEKNSQSPAKSKNLKRQGKPSKELGQKRNKRDSSPTTVYNEVDPDEPTYCLCAQVSFGEMIGCDNNSCPIEWFHFQCVQLTTKPKGKWYCPKCRGDRPNVPKK